MRFAHHSDYRDLYRWSDQTCEQCELVRTPDAVRIGFALSLGSSTALKLSGTAAMMSTSRGLPCSLCFFDTVKRNELRLTLSFASCAFASSETISEHVFMSASA